MKALRFSYIILFFISVAIHTHTQAQQIVVKPSNNKVELNGKTYFIHIVRQSETLFAISQAYNVPVDTIKKDNLHITNELKINQYLKIRVKPIELTEKEFIVFHKVVKGDTPYNIAARYGVKIETIYAYNPTATLGISINEVLKIPEKPAPIAEPHQIVNEQIRSKVSDQGYIIHVVAKKETIYGIAAKYNTTQQKIIELNPKLQDAPLQIGDELKIEIESIQEASTKGNYYYHKVEKQETIYKLTKQYTIKEKDLVKLNPSLKQRSLQVGELIKIPKNEISDSILSIQPVFDTIRSTPKPDKYSLWRDTLIQPICNEYPIDTFTKYKVAFFLPFYLNINDTLGKFTEVKVRDENGIESYETIARTGNIEDKIYSRSKLFINFYQGALIALQNLKEQGVSFDIHVFDTQDDSIQVKKLLKENDLADFDLIIGPVFNDIINIVGDYAWEHQINIVSPLATKNDFIVHNPYAFQVSPPLEVQMHHASEYLNALDTKNYIVVHDGKNLDQEYISMFKKQLFAQMNDQNFDQIKYNEVLYYDARDSVLKEVFTKGMKNIVIVPSSNQAFVTDVMGKLNGYSFEYDITIFGQPRWSRFENIDLDNFHNTNTHLFSNSFIDYSLPPIHRFVKQYRFHFKDEPDKYAFQGYDVTNYFCTALNKYGRDFRKCIHMHHPELLQTKYNFVPYADQGGYQNTAIYIIEYSKNDKIEKVIEYPASN